LSQTRGIQFREIFNLVTFPKDPLSELTASIRSDTEAAVSHQVKSLESAAVAVNSVALNLAIENLVPADKETCADQLGYAMEIIAAAHSQLRREIRSSCRRL
jgi:hypothetical protein